MNGRSLQMSRAANLQATLTRMAEGRGKGRARNPAAKVPKPFGARRAPLQRLLQLPAVRRPSPPDSFRTPAAPPPVQQESLVGSSGASGLGSHDLLPGPRALLLFSPPAQQSVALSPWEGGIVQETTLSASESRAPLSPVLSVSSSASLLPHPRIAELPAPAEGAALEVASMVFEAGAHPEPLSPEPPAEGSMDLVPLAGSATAAASSSAAEQAVAQALLAISSTNCHTMAVPMRPAVPAARCVRRRREYVSRRPPVAGDIPRHRTPAAYRGKGSKHANRCGGPWVSALELMPALPPKGRARALAGLANTRIVKEDMRVINQTREACALVAILPRECAGFILAPISEAALEAMPVADVVQRLVRVVSGFGISSIAAGYSVLGQLFTWAVANRPDASVLDGSVVSDWLAAVPPSSRTEFGINWLRDYCGIDLPARMPVMRPARGVQPRSSNNTETLTLRDVWGLELIANEHPSEFMRSHAAGWSFLWQSSLRVEQSSSMCINGIINHAYRGSTFRIASSSVRRDKHPDPSKRRPRPAWGVIDGLFFEDAIINGVFAMLKGAEDLCCILRDTDSISGAPDDSASQWLYAPLEAPARIAASLQHLLESHPICRPPEEAAKFGGHAAKRFAQNVCQDATELTPQDATEIARFSKSVAQLPELVPSDEMLRRHQVLISILPDRYGKDARVHGVFDSLCCLHGVVARAAARFQLVAETAMPQECGWGADGWFRTQ